ncbi:transmembrane protein 26-like [Lytechinus pictus]|uniref:transmembrane protein 26-like n=1 Tax=Lytechinus pictus TaxID=7653 RepID=UPI0030BA1BF6
MGIVSIAKGLLARVFFAVHGILATWRATSVYQSNIYYVLLAPLIVLPVEMGITFGCTENGEWKWLCPSVLLYLLSVVPSLWLLQFDLYNTRIDYRDEQGWEECSADTVYNSSSLEAVQGVTIPVEFSSVEWELILQQTLLCLLILGRWLLPKGDLTRDQLSQLLLVYIGMAADILEFNLESLKDEKVFCDVILIVLILGIWSWSLVQFCLVLTSVAGKRRRVVLQDGSNSCSAECCSCCLCCRNEMWSMMVTLIMQDGPFLAMRLYLMIKVKIFSIMMVFFTCKNILVILLQLYRMIILCGQNEVEPEENEEGKPDENKNSAAPPDAVVVVSS